MRLRKRGRKGKKRIEDKLLLVEVCGYVFPYISARVPASSSSSSSTLIVDR